MRPQSHKFGFDIADDVEKNEAADDDGHGDDNDNAY